MKRGTYAREKTLSMRIKTEKGTTLADNSLFVGVKAVAVT